MPLRGRRYGIAFSPGAVILSAAKNLGTCQWWLISNKYRSAWRFKGFKGFRRFKGLWIALRAMNFICRFAAGVTRLPSRRAQLFWAKRRILVHDGCDSFAINTSRLLPLWWLAPPPPLTPLHLLNLPNPGQLCCPFIFRARQGATTPFEPSAPFEPSEPGAALLPLYILRPKGATFPSEPSAPFEPSEPGAASPSQ